MWRLGVIKSLLDVVQRDVSLWMSAVRCWELQPGSRVCGEHDRCTAKQAALSVGRVIYFVPQGTSQNSMVDYYGHVLSADDVDVLYCKGDNACLHVATVQRCS
jgi:hypothetical protein